MKTKIIAASIVAILIVVAFSCGLFSSSERTREFNILGKWTIDSIDNKGSDSSKNMALVLLAFSGKDSSKVGIQFNNDSTFQYTNTGDSTKGHYYLSDDNKSLFIKEDSVNYQFNLLERSDSAVSFSSLDSVYYYLRRK